MELRINNVPVEDTYCEAFDGLYARLVVTAKDEKRLMKAALGSTALPCTVFGESEGGVEKYLAGDETPDGRSGAVIQIWVGCGRNEREKLEYELGKRIRQGILVVPTTRVYNFLDSTEKIDLMDNVGHCGDGYERTETRYGREVINIPLMMGEFLIEKHVGYAKGVMGGNVWIMCDSEDSALEAGDAAVEAVNGTEGAIASFDVCSAGSKVETNYPEIGPTTNHPYCPALKGKIPDYKVPDGVTSIPEIVINGTNREAVEEAMKAAMKAAAEIKGVKMLTAGNYGGKLGKHKINLKDLLIN
ncbi:MAG: formylmethanofuran--tetrahydromethanopterin N-formyltransferase [Candidatus Altiarchaeota archaeon]|nr:formylmethanofuran--tetrahydromethanopterin N-formyltransferase [Candidatus Altiarchaeota archaeon]